MAHETVDLRDGIRRLGESMVVEYRDEFSAGQVLRCVHVSAKQLFGAGVRGRGLIELTERRVRGKLGKVPTLAH